MKQCIIVGSILLCIALVVWFDAIVVFLLSGFIPGINVTLAPSTMLAIMTAATILARSLRHRQAVYRHCLKLYDHIHVSTAKQSSGTHSTSKLPRRRYQQL